MRASVVDWTLFVLVTVASITGLITLTLGDWHDRLVFYAHGAVGLALIVPLILKFRRVTPRLIRPAIWSWKVLVSVLASLAILMTIGTGVVWTVAQEPHSYPSGMNLHILFALLLIPLYLLHTVLRFRWVRSRDVEGRRTAMQFLGIWAAGGLSWLLQGGTSHALGTFGAARRFTGSRETSSFSGNTLPITNWLLDHPAPIDIALWRLRVYGAVSNELSLQYVDLQITDEERAVIDCTGGWFSSQDWQGIRVGRLLDLAHLRPGAVAVSFQSTTGYRWSMPLPEARHALLATQVGNQPLSHGHGAPLRLVAPGRRGFQWVKWVTGVQVLTQQDDGQWVAIFSSGLRARDTS